ncbi:ABC-2 type transport system permease protein [Chitinophaga sp. YR573]|uniref:Gldg family protein n=1 Tax=Chitinophaga sp. YR573 TaxID=1881040 RepID=UPI0008AD704E|nr:Gldg family protein [Chitinophaga sp. YR573]SEW43344.1 ABC-2 type transport system permease protein [Chitinophaga sp. YR573]
MKKIFKIARTELQTLFYSPIAWLILVIFAVQTAFVFTNSVDQVLKNQMLGSHFTGLTLWMFNFEGMLDYLYAYMPLLTMGLISRELGTGSIKLLYSSPITNTQIILGKFLAMTIYGFLLIGILVVYAIFGVAVIKQADIPVLLVALLGIYLLICAYAAIGLFMSSLTSYQVVAAMGTLALLGVLKYVGFAGQNIDFLRDITYWLSISSRSRLFMFGLISSEDILYFVIVISLFLVFSVLKLNATKNNKSFTLNGVRFLTVFIVAMLLGYLSSRPVLKGYYDATRTKMNTLTPNSQHIVERLKGGLTITTYVNLFDKEYYRGTPEAVNIDRQNFLQYTWFKPEIKMKYVYYYHQSDNPSSAMEGVNGYGKDAMERICMILNLDPKLFLSPDEIKKQIDLEPEHYHFVRQIQRDSGQKTFLRIYNDISVTPSEREITAALKRLVMELPKVGFLTGHDERSIDKENDRQYYEMAKNVSYRQALINQGFDVQDIDADKDIPNDINTLVIAEMKKGLSAAETEKLNYYITKGGNLFILGEPGRQEFMNPLVAQFGVQFMPGELVKPSESNSPDIIAVRPTAAALGMSDMFKEFELYKGLVLMPGTTGLSYDTTKGYHVTPLFVSDSTGSWNELQTTNFNDDKPVLDVSSGEQEKSFPVILALTRKTGGKEQKIIISGDADCISKAALNAQLKGINSMNFGLINGAFFWLSNGEVPIDVSRPGLPDDHVNLTLNELSWLKLWFIWILPSLLTLAGILIWVIRKRR